VFQRKVADGEITYIEEKNRIPSPFLCHTDSTYSPLTQSASKQFMLKQGLLTEIGLN
jgi:hypothetical protein